MAPSQGVHVVWRPEHPNGQEEGPCKAHGPRLLRDPGTGANLCQTGDSGLRGQLHTPNPSGEVTGCHPEAHGGVGLRFCP